MPSCVLRVCKTYSKKKKAVFRFKRLWTQYCRVSKVLQNTIIDNPTKFISNTQRELTDRGDKCLDTVQNEEYTAAANPKSVKDIIPESRLARFYGNFYYDEHREKCYINANEKGTGRYVNGHGCDNSDLTECWMLPEVEYLFRKLTDETSECAMRRRRHYNSQPDDFITNDYRLAASERWGLAGVGSEAAEASLARRVRAVRALWDPGPASLAPTASPSPPVTPRKMRARRRQPHRSANYTSSSLPTPRYCLDVSAHAPLLCDPSHKFQFEAPRQQQTMKCQRAMAWLPASVQVGMHASNAGLSHCRPPLGRFVAVPPHISPRGELYPLQQYALESPRRDMMQLNMASHVEQAKPTSSTSNTPDKIERSQDRSFEHESSDADARSEFVSLECRDVSSPHAATSADNTYQKLPPSASMPSVDDCSRTRRLYSTVLSMSAPRPLSLAPGVVRLSQKQIPPGLLKLNPKIILPATRFRTTTVDKKFEELEKEALEQYKTSDESIDTKFRELEKQAVEQYNVSNSNTSCSSENSGEKSTAPTASTPTPPSTLATLQPPCTVSKVECANKSVPKFYKDETVGSVLIHSQNFPVLDTKGLKPNVITLKNFPLPQRGEKKQQGHKPRKNLRNFKSDSSYVASDTDFESRAALKSGHKVPVRWAVHVAPPKKRMKKNVTVSVSEMLLNHESVVPISAAIHDLAPLHNHAASRAKMSAHGAGDLEPAIRKT